MRTGRNNFLKLIAILPFTICIIFETLQQLSYSLAGKRPNKKIFFFGFGIFFYLIMLLSWYWLLIILPLGIATPLMGASYATVGLASNIFFKEQIDFKHWGGIALIIVGLTLISMS